MAEKQNTFPLVHTETLEEHVCFKIPNDIPPEEIFAVIAAIQAYLKDAQDKNDGWNSMVKSYRRLLVVHLYLVCNAWFNVLLQEILNPKDIYSEDSAFTRRTFSFYRELKRDRALHIGNNTRRHAAQAYGILIGSAPRSIPDVTGLRFDASAEETDILIVDANMQHALHLSKIVSDVLPEVKVYCIDTIRKREMFGLLAKAKLVIGKTSLETYLACCFGKQVIELYPTTMPRHWLSKWSASGYKMLVCNEVVKETDVDAFKVALRYSWATIKSLPLVAKVELDATIMTEQ